MEQFTGPGEGQNDGQETAADHPLPIKAGRSRLDAPDFSLLVVQRLGLTIHSVSRILPREAKETGGKGGGLFEREADLRGRRGPGTARSEHDACNCSCQGT